MQGAQTPPYLIHAVFGGLPWGDIYYQHAGDSADLQSAVRGNERLLRITRLFFFRPSLLLLCILKFFQGKKKHSLPLPPSLAWSMRLEYQKDGVKPAVVKLKLQAPQHICDDNPCIGHADKGKEREGGSGLGEREGGN